ncbi:ASCH domain-containing protein [Dickeya fangzhongdai]|uniref:ASCH domain-containing protein n=1 Tax=Dickeya fangzhongdai TaxID=1778540 RepID=UPI0023E42BEA|nr:ASCH domain-containing protein [Dickeya fangzhongdai]WES88803.1 ASCH domain-containing protein [Dickeya fangzhongdai]
MKALSIRQPWAWLIVNGYKDIENRTWHTKYRGQVLIHAAATMPTPAEWREAMRVAQLAGAPAIPSFEMMDKGGIVGYATITGTCESSSSPWFFGPVGFQLADARPIPLYPFRGRLNIFDTGLAIDGDRLVREVDHA